MVVAGDLNGYVGIDRAGYNKIHGGHGLDVVNGDGIQVLYFATAYEMKILPEAKKPSCDLQQGGGEKVKLTTSC